jgi:hypothetical protein
MENKIYLDKTEYGFAKITYIGSYEGDVTKEQIQEMYDFGLGGSWNYFSNGKYSFSSYTD